MMIVFNINIMTTGSVLMFFLSHAFNTGRRSVGESELTFLAIDARVFCSLFFFFFVYMLC